MDFRSWIIKESSLDDLYDSAVKAFPTTRKRQHATDEIAISGVRWVPYLGVKTLFVRSLAQNEQNGHEYGPMIVFKGVRYHIQNDSPELVKLRTEGRIYLFEPLSLEQNDVLVRCQCKDFHWRFQHFDHLDKSLYGSNRKKYEAKYNPGSANPMRLPGMCKHLMKLMKVLAAEKIFSDY